MSPQPPEKDSTLPTPDITITFGPDGRILLHDLTARFIPVALAICPDDQDLAQRLNISQQHGEQR
jgi:hypothetical protein